jgi:hypothetical protein
MPDASPRVSPVSFPLPRHLRAADPYPSAARPPASSAPSTGASASAAAARPRAPAWAQHSCRASSPPGRKSFPARTTSSGLVSMIRQAPATRAPCTTCPMTLFEAVSATIRRLHYSPRTEEAYLQWIRAFVGFHRGRHPREMGAAEVTAFLRAYPGRAPVAGRQSRFARLRCSGSTGKSPPSPSRLGVLASLWPARSALPG